MQPERAPYHTRIVFVATAAGGERSYFGLQIFFPVDRTVAGSLPESDYDYIWLPP